jgi:hypothetical protein
MKWFWGVQIFKVYQNLLHHPLLFFTKSVFITFMDDYDEIYNYSGLKYDTYEIFDTFWLISFDTNQNT